jgi:hypothetical protein
MWRARFPRRSEPEQYPSLNPDAGQPVAVASDPQGSAVLADLATNCSAQNDQSVVLATRPPAGSFRLSTALRCHPIFSPNPFPAVAAGKDGGLALLTVTGTPGRYALVVQTRYQGRLSSPHTLAHSGRLPNPVGAPVVDAGGGVTIGWLTCTASGGNCTESAARGSLSSDTWHTRTFGQPGEQIGNGYVALSRCARGVCQISVSLVVRHGRFGNPITLTRDGQIAYRDELIEASGGRRRERAIVWTSSHGGLFASVSDPGRPGLWAHSPARGRRHRVRGPSGLPDRSARPSDRHLAKPRRHRSRSDLRGLSRRHSRKGLRGTAICDQPMRTGLLCKCRHSSPAEGIPQRTPSASATASASEV